MIDERTTEVWIDEGGTRDAAEAATKRASSARDRRPSPEVAPEVVAAIHDAVGSQRGAKLAARLADAAAALERERFGDAKRMVSPLVKELPGVAAVHEVNGLINYRQGNWRQAASALEAARAIDLDPAMLPVLADAYRAQRDWAAVERLWDDIKAISPSQEVMAEGRIIAASALADRGALNEAIQLLAAASTPPKRVRDHHLRQWYVLADLYDRVGDQVAATRWFRLIVAQDAAFADTRDRLRALGR